MKNPLKLALVSFSLLCPALGGMLHAQGYVVDAQITSQAAGNGTYNYTIQLNNDGSSTASIGTFWFAWVPDYYGYDLLTASPTVIQMPYGWYSYPNNNSYYYPDGYSLEFYNYYGSALAPGDSFTFGFNSSESPATLAQNSPYYNIPTLTSYVYDVSGSDPGTKFFVTPTAVPEPSTTGLMGIGVAGLLFTAKRRISISKHPVS